MLRIRALTLASTSFVLGAVFIMAMGGTGCGSGEEADAQSLPLEFVDMTYGGLHVMSARVGNATLRGTVAGHVSVDASSGVVNGQLTAVFDDGLQVDLAFQDGNAQMQVPGTTVVVANDLDDTILINGQPESMRDQIQSLFDALQQDERPSMLPPQTQAFAPYWLMRYTWAWFVNTWVAQKDITGERRPIGAPLWIKLNCAMSVPLLVPILQAAGCADAELLCAGGRRYVMIGGILVPCSWILAMCVNGQFVGANTAFDAWLLLAGR